MTDTFEPAIEALKEQLAREEMRLDETRSLLNRLCEMAGRPKMFPDTPPAGGEPDRPQSPDRHIQNKALHGRAGLYEPAAPPVSGAPLPLRDFRLIVWTGPAPSPQRKRAPRGTL